MRPLGLKPVLMLDALRGAEAPLFHGIPCICVLPLHPFTAGCAGSSLIGEELFRCGGTSAISLALRHRPGRTWSEWPCDARWWAGKGVLVLRCRRRRGLRAFPLSGHSRQLGRVVSGLRGCGGAWDQQWRGACGRETWVRWSWGLGIAFKSTVVNMRDKRLAAQFAGGCEEPSSFARRTAEGGCPHIGISAEGGRPHLKSPQTASVDESQRIRHAGGWLAAIRCG